MSDLTPDQSAGDYREITRRLDEVLAVVDRYDPRDAGLLRR